MLHLFLLFWLAAAALLAPQADAAGERAFDRHAENQRYRQWLDTFRQDLGRLRNIPPPRAADLDAHFANSIVPGSRAAKLMKELAAASPGGVSGEIRFAGIQRIFLGVLADSVVAGDGGIFPETQPAFQQTALRVRYMHVDGGGRAERYFSDPETFKPYRLPEPGVFARDAYPFLLFEERDGKLRLGGVSKEFWDLVTFMDALQHA
ncbi:hypothetical protein KYC_01869 [Achromobacter arsenitoxydans SY8]|uniref:Uncharacterized protein n=1 Tax=Achromobacter arsenitoxydans SY8 TaxID=477184 RepID=H0F0U2_9BURK|nr:hypothetical protein KYC_01869 [Achromobacter arsenitoxydans SY8]